MDRRHRRSTVVRGCRPNPKVTPKEAAEYELPDLQDPTEIREQLLFLADLSKSRWLADIVDALDNDQNPFGLDILWRGLYEFVKSQENEWMAVFDALPHTPSAEGQHKKSARKGWRTLVQHLGDRGMSPAPPPGLLATASEAAFVLEGEIQDSARLPWPAIRAVAEGRFTRLRSLILSFAHSSRRTKNGQEWIDPNRFLPERLALMAFVATSNILLAKEILDCSSCDPKALYAALRNVSRWIDAFGGKSRPFSYDDVVSISLIGRKMLEQDPPRSVQKDLKKLLQWAHPLASDREIMARINDRRARVDRQWAISTYPGEYEKGKQIADVVGQAVDYLMGRIDQGEVVLVHGRDGELIYQYIRRNRSVDSKSLRYAVTSRSLTTEPSTPDAAVLRYLERILPKEVRAVHFDTGYSGSIPQWFRSSGWQVADIKMISSSTPEYKIPLRGKDDKSLRDSVVETLERDSEGHEWHRLDKPGSKLDSLRYSLSSAGFWARLYGVEDRLLEAGGVAPRIPLQQIPEGARPEAGWWTHSDPGFIAYVQGSARADRVEIEVVVLRPSSPSCEVVQFHKKRVRRKRRATKRKP